MVCSSGNFEKLGTLGFPPKTWRLSAPSSTISIPLPLRPHTLPYHRSRAPVFIQKMSYQVPDPNSLTIPKLKSVLAQHGFGDQLPAHQEKKGFYVDLYRKHIVPLLEARNAASQSLTPGPPASTSAASAKERTTKTDLVDRRRTIHCTPLFLLSLHVGHCPWAS